MQVLIISTNKIDVIVLPLNDRGRRSSFILGFFESPSIGWIYNFNLDIGSCESATSIFGGVLHAKISTEIVITSAILRIWMSLALIMMSQSNANRLGLLWCVES